MMKPVYKIETKEIHGRKYIIGYQLIGETDESMPVPSGQNLFVGELPRELFDDYFQPMYCFNKGAIVKTPLPAPEKALLEKELRSLNEYLNSTDWYIVRFIERGIAVPAEVSESRSRAINRINEIKAILLS